MSIHLNQVDALPVSLALETGRHYAKIYNLAALSLLAKRRAARRVPSVFVVNKRMVIYPYGYSPPTISFCPTREVSGRFRGRLYLIADGEPYPLG